MQTIRQFARRPSKQTLALTLAFSVLAAAIISLGTVLLVKTSDELSEQTRSLLLATLELQMAELESEFSQYSAQETASVLVEADAVLALAGAESAQDLDAEALAQVEAALAVLVDGSRLYDSYYVYLATVGWLISQDSAGANIIDGFIAPEALENAAVYLDGADVGAYAHWLGATEDGTDYSCDAVLLAQGVYFISINTQTVSYTGSFSPTITSYISDAMMYSYDQYGNKHVLGGDDALLEAYSYADFGDDDSGCISVEIEGHSYLVAFCTFEQRGMRFAIFIQDVAIENAQRLGLLMAAVDAVALVLCVACAYLLARRTFKPLDDVIARFGGEDAAGRRDDFTIVSDLLDKQEGTIKSQQELLLDSWILGLLHGSGSERFGDYREVLAVDYDEEKLALVGFELDPGDGAEGPSAAADFAQGALEGLHACGYRGRFIEGEEVPLLIVGMGAHPLADPLCELDRQLGKRAECDAVFFVSDEIASDVDFKARYDEIRCVMRFSRATGARGMVITYRDVEELAFAGDPQAKAACRAREGRMPQDAPAQEGEPAPTVATHDPDRMRFEELKTYVDANYQDPNLSSKAVAAHFGIAMSSVTRLFKKYRQCGFLEYVHRLRVNEASMLLRTTAKSEAEIAGMVGYNNVTTMIRAFKKYAKTTPSSLRDRDRGQNS